MEDAKKVAVLGCGVIGASWTALFLAAGFRVSVHDPNPAATSNLHDSILQYWPALRTLGLTDRQEPAAVHICVDAADAVDGADFIQENVPEQLEMKHALYAQIEPHLHEKAVVASSASGLMISEMQRGWRNPSRFIIGHPFNPPHLIPLVELVGNEKTDDGVVQIAEDFYRTASRVTIRIRREVPAHVANRLQAALWREALYLVQSGVASVEDVDKAVWAGPGLRWAAMGPHMLFHLGAGPGGITEFCNRYRDSFHRWWDDMGDIELTPELVRELSAGVQAECGEKNVAEKSKERDALIVGMLRAMADMR